MKHRPKTSLLDHALINLSRASPATVGSQLTETPSCHIDTPPAAAHRTEDYLRRLSRRQSPMIAPTTLTLVGHTLRDRVLESAEALLGLKTYWHRSGQLAEVLA